MYIFTAVNSGERCGPWASCFSNTVGLFETKYYVKGYGTTGMNIYTNGIGHMTKMAAIPIYGKNPSKELWGGGGGLQ